MTDAAVLPLHERSADRTVGGNVKWLMWDRNVSQGEFAARLGVDQSTLSLKLNGKRKWTVDELIATSDHFGVTVDSLVRPRDMEPKAPSSDYGYEGSVIDMFTRQPLVLADAS